MCQEEAVELPRLPPGMTRKELRRQKRIEELTNFYNMCSGAYGQTTGTDAAAAARALAALEAIILDTPFAG